MSKTFKAVVRGLFALAALVLMSTVLSGQAEAAQNRTCNSTRVSTNTITICVEFGRSGQPPYALEPYALAGYATPSFAEPTNFWAGLYQCNNSTGPECVLISASRDYDQISFYPEPNKYKIVTSSKPYSYGHTYKACTTVSGNLLCTRETT